MNEVSRVVAWFQKLNKPIFESMGSKEVSIQAPRVVRRKPSMVDRLVFLDDQDPFDVALVKMKMEVMFRKSWFSICVVSDAIELLRISKVDTQKTYARLNMLHCMDWNAMPNELKIGRASCRERVS